MKNYKTKNRTRQEIFDLAYIGLAKQGFKRSYQKETSTDGPFCLYRAPDGKKCAIGFCIPDEEYRPNLEGGDAWLAYKAAGISGRDFNFAERLQGVHDHSKFPSEMEQDLRMFANEYGLTIPEV